MRAWCAEHVPTDWRPAQTGVSDREFVDFQKAWFAELDSAGFAVPHWPAEWGGGMSVAEQIVLYQELAAHDAPRLVLAFVGIHHAASTLLVAPAPKSNAAGTCRRSVTVRSGCRASPNRRPDRTWPHCAPPHDVRVMSMWSTGRSCGPAVVHTPTGACCSPGPTPMRPSGTAFRTS